MEMYTANLSMSLYNKHEKLIQRLSLLDTPLSYSRQQIDDTDISNVEEVLRSPFITTGKASEQFESALCEVTGAKHAIVCTNGTTALHLACLAIKVCDTDFGLTSPITFLSSANCLEFCGARADFIDIDLDTLCLSSENLDQYCRLQAIPKVVIPVDFAGIPADLPSIKKLSDNYGFKIIEDAAHSLGSTYIYNGKEFKCGSCAHSDLAIFSFHPVKNITTGEGGAVLTNDDVLAERVRKMRSHGVVRSAGSMRDKEGPWYYEMDELSYNCRITDFQCALGLSQLQKLDLFKNKRLGIVNKYNRCFKKNDLLITPPMPSNGSVFFHIYTLQFMQGSKVRDFVYKTLKSFNIFCQVHYIPVYKQPYYQERYHYPDSKCKNAELYYSRCLTLPMYPDLDEDIIDFVIDVVLDSVNRYPEFN
jgi:perosamine synthetase